MPLLYSREIPAEAFRLGDLPISVYVNRTAFIESLSVHLKASSQEGIMQPGCQRSRRARLPMDFSTGCACMRLTC